MRKPTSIFLILLFIAQLGLAQTLDNCTITATVYKEDGTPLSGQAVIVHKVTKGGYLVRSVRTAYLTNASGVVTFKFAQGAVAHIEAPVEGFKALGGQAVQIPNAASATLESLQRVTMPEQVAVAVPPSGVAVQLAGVAKGEFETINFDSSFAFSESNGIATFNIAPALAGKALLNHNHDASYEPKNVNIQAHIARVDNPHVVTKSQVGLGNVDNTSDLNKPISTAVQTALDLKLDIGDVFSGSYLDLTDVPATFAPSAHTHVIADTTGLQAALNAKQDADSDPGVIAGLSPANDDLLQRKAGAWVNRTPSQVKTDLAITKGDVGLGSVDNVQQQPINPILSDLAELTQAAGKGIYFDSSTTAATFDLNAFALTFLDDADAAAVRSTLGAAPTSHTHPLSEITDEGALAALNTVGASQIDNDAVTDAKLRNSAALSIIGRSVNSTGDPADISAANDGEVLRRSGTSLGFGTIATVGITDDAVTNAKMANMAAATVKGRNSGSGDPGDLTTLPNAVQDNITRLGTIASGSVPQSLVAGLGYVVIQTRVASSSSTMDFTSGLDDSYDSYVLVITDAVPATDDVGAWVRVQTGGSTWQVTNYNYGGSLQPTVASSPVGIGNSGTTEIRVTLQGGGTGVGNDPTEGISLDLKFTNPESSKLHLIEWSGSYFRPADGVGYVTAGTGNYTVAGPITGLRFQFSVGAVASGRATLYGRKKS